MASDKSWLKPSDDANNAFFRTTTTLSNCCAKRFLPLAMIAGSLALPVYMIAYTMMLGDAASKQINQDDAWSTSGLGIVNSVIMLPIYPIAYSALWGIERLKESFPNVGYGSVASFWNNATNYLGSKFIEAAGNEQQQKGDRALFGKVALTSVSQSFAFGGIGYGVTMLFASAIGLPALSFSSGALPFAFAGLLATPIATAIVGSCSSQSPFQNFNVTEPAAATLLDSTEVGADT